jgi:hypothetical protein
MPAPAFPALIMTCIASIHNLHTVLYCSIERRSAKVDALLPFSLRCLPLHPETLKESISTMSGAATAVLRDEIRSALADVGLTKVDSAILSKCT